MADEIDPLRKVINELVDTRIEARLKGGTLPPAGATIEVPDKINVVESFPRYIFTENLPARELSDSDTLGKVFALIYHDKLPQERFNMSDVVKQLENVYACASSGSKLRDTLEDLIKLRVLEKSKNGSHVSYTVRQDFHGRVTLKENKSNGGST